MTSTSLKLGSKIYVLKMLRSKQKIDHKFKSEHVREKNNDLGSDQV